MYCPECGANNRDAASFCMKCGKEIHMESSGSPAKSAEAAGNISAPEPGSLLEGRYRIVTRLGSGGMGRLYLADDTRMNFPVVIKQMNHSYQTEEKLGYLEKRFLSEAQLLFRLKHRSLPRVVDYFNKEHSSYIIMEYVAGENLSQFVANKENGRLGVDECFLLMRKTLDILIYLHNQTPPIIHRDIKPGNLMLDSDGEVMLVDFGLARHLPKGKQATARVGTYGFASPEHQTGKVSTASDLYSFGATFHALLSGENPKARLPFTFPPLSQYRDDIPPELQLIFDRLLEFKMANRYQKAEDVQKDLLNIKGEFAEIPDTLLKPEKPGKKSGRGDKSKDEPSTVIGDDKGWADEETVIEGG